MFTVTNFAVAHLRQMDWNAEARTGLLRLPDPWAVVRLWAQHPAYTLWYAEAPQVCVGCVEPWGRVGELWAVMSRHCATWTVSLQRRLLTTMQGLLERQIVTRRLRRVHATARKQAHASRRLLRALGFQQCSVWPCYGPQGETLVWYVRYHWE